MSEIENINFVKVRDVKSPARASGSDAGLDLFVPEVDVDFAHKIMAISHKVWPNLKPTDHNTVVGLTIKPGGRILIPSGVHFRTPEGTALIAFNKSGIATKLGLAAGAQVCDASYQGELHISLINTSHNDVEIIPGQKIIQFLLVPIHHSMPKEIDNLKDLYSDHKSDRGDGGFGSTGDK